MKECLHFHEEEKAYEEVRGTFLLEFHCMQKEVVEDNRHFVVVTVAVAEVPLEEHIGVVLVEGMLLVPEKERVEVVQEHLRKEQVMQRLQKMFSEPRMMETKL